MEQPTLIFRPPSTSPAEAPFTPPTTQWIHGLWHVNHSSLPMWKSKRNVTITYTPLGTPPTSFDNLVKYQSLDSDKISTVEGIEKPDDKIPAAWNWRGKGWLKIASSSWEVLGWGEEEGGWLVIYFQKTMFTPAGVDVLARRKEGVGADMLGRIQQRMKEVEDNGFKKCADELFEVKHDP